MEPLASELRLSAFKATDAFAVEAYRATRSLGGTVGAALAEEIRRTVVRSGGGIVAASTSEAGGIGERQHLERARACLAEGRYYLHLARRFGLLDAKRYHALTVRQEGRPPRGQSSRSIGGAFSCPVFWLLFWLLVMGVRSGV